MQAHLFEPFFTTKKRGEGGGLGLCTVYGIVGQSEGHISIYSKEGRGTTAKVYLPRTDLPAEAEAAAEPEGVVRGGTETVLLAEDDELLRKAACRALRNSGYKVLEAKDGGEALLLAQSHPGVIDLLLSDVIMPGLDGCRLREKLLQVRPGLKCLLMSGYTGALIAQKGILETETSFLQKPFATVALLRKVRAVLDT